jgi:hypothetical protein
MQRVYTQSQSCTPSTAVDPYIVKILRVINNGIAAMSSADELLILDCSDFRPQLTAKLTDPGVDLTSLAVDRTGQRLFCGGSEGVVSVFDIRTQKRISRISVRE